MVSDSGSNTIVVTLFVSITIYVNIGRQWNLAELLMNMKCSNELHLFHYMLHLLQVLKIA